MAIEDPEDSSCTQAQRLLITGATGNIGYSFLTCFMNDSSTQQAIESGTLIVRAACYRRSSKVSLIRSIPNLEIVMVDADSADDCAAAFRHVDVAYLIPSGAPNRVKHILNFVDAAKDGTVNFLLLLSWIRNDESNKQRQFASEFAEMESYVEDSGVDYTFIRTGVLLQTLSYFSQDIRDGVLPLPIGEVKFAPVNVNDVGKVAKVILEDPQRHNRKAYHIVGPELVNGRDLAQMASDALQMNVRYANITDDGCMQLLMDSGLEKKVAHGFVEIFQDIREGYYEFADDLLEKMTGDKPTPIEQFFASNNNPIMKDGSVFDEGEQRYTATSRGKESQGTSYYQTKFATVGHRERASPTKSTTTACYPDVDQLVHELEETKETLSRWTFQHEQLLTTLNEITRTQKERHREFVEFRAEVQNVLSEMRRR